MQENLLNQTFSQILMDKRTELKLTNAKMSEICCISNREYSDLEKGVCLPQFKTLVNMLINLNIDFNEYIKTITDMGYQPIDKY